MPSNPELLQGLQFGYTPRQPRTADSGGNPNMVEAHLGGQRVGEIHWDHNGEIKRVWTDPSVRRNGVGNALVSHAREHEPAIRHARERTRAGDAWAKQAGGRVPKLTLMKSMDD